MCVLVFLQPYCRQRLKSLDRDSCTPRSVNCCCKQLCSVVQASGEATFTSDVVAGEGQLYAATVASTQALAHIESIDTSAANKVCNHLCMGRASQSCWAG